jgi:hypothetical protein
MMESKEIAIRSKSKSGDGVIYGRCTIDRRQFGFGRGPNGDRLVVDVNDGDRPPGFAVEIGPGRGRKVTCVNMWAELVDGRATVFVSIADGDTDLVEVQGTIEARDLRPSQVSFAPKLFNTHALRIANGPARVQLSGPLVSTLVNKTAKPRAT